MPSGDHAGLSALRLSLGGDLDRSGPRLKVNDEDVEVLGDGVVVCGPVGKGDLRAVGRPRRVSVLTPGRHDRQTDGTTAAAERHRLQEQPRRHVVVVRAKAPTYEHDATVLSRNGDGESRRGQSAQRCERESHTQSAKHEPTLTPVRIRSKVAVNSVRRCLAHSPPVRLACRCWRAPPPRPLLARTPRAANDETSALVGVSQCGREESNLHARRRLRRPSRGLGGGGGGGGEDRSGGNGGLGGGEDSSGGDGGFGGGDAGGTSPESGGGGGAGMGGAVVNDGGAVTVLNRSSTRTARARSPARSRRTWPRARRGRCRSSGLSPEPTRRSPRPAKYTADEGDPESGKYYAKVKQKQANEITCLKASRRRRASRHAARG